jgi:hypothetical protein
MSGIEDRIAHLSPKQRALLELRLGKLRAPGQPHGGEPRPDAGNAASSFPLSFSQQRLWFVDRLESESAAYNIAYAIRVRGRLDAGMLWRAMDEVVRRQHALRTVFEEAEGQVVQRIEAARSVPMPLVDLGALPRERREPHARSIVAEDSRLSFHLGRWPLMRCKLLRLDDDEHVLGIVTHHIISDGWSMVVLIRDLTLVYVALVAGAPSPLPELPAQYRSFVEWQWSLGSALEEQRAYWRKKLAGAPVFLDFPTDHPRPAVQSFRGGREDWVFPAALTEGIRLMSREEEGCTLFVILLALFKCLVRHHSRQDDLVVSAPISYRNRAELEGLVGFFVNTLLLRTDLSGDPTFREALARVRTTMVEAYAHQDVPLDMAVQEASPPRVLSYSPLLQLGANFLHEDLGGVAALSDLSGAAESREISELQIEEFDFDYANAAMELGLVISYGEHGMKGSLHYKADLFDRATIVALLEDFQFLLGMVVQEREVRVSGISRALAARGEARRSTEKEKAKMASGRSLRDSRRKAFSVPG